MLINKCSEKGLGALIQLVLSAWAFWECVSLWKQQDPVLTPPVLQTMGDLSLMGNLGATIPGSVKNCGRLGICAGLGFAPKGLRGLFQPKLCCWSVPFSCPSRPWVAAQWAPNWRWAVAICSPWALCPAEKWHQRVKDLKAALYFVSLVAPRACWALNSAMMLV